MQKHIPIKSILLLLCAVCIAGHASGQQEQLYTMFMYNKLGLNPAYAGYQGTPCVTAIYRNQWMGFEGAPETKLLSFNAPISNDRLGLGFVVNQHTIGISSRLTIDGIYAYRIPLGRGTLSLAAQASGRNHEVDYGSPLIRSVQDLAIDPGVEQVKDSKFLLNFGAGLYYADDFFYAGISAPRLMSSDIDFDENELFVAREVRHVYFMTGAVFPLSYRLDLIPQLLVKYAEASPVDMDINASLSWKKKFTFGVTYRTGGATDDIAESIDLMASARIARGLMLGVAYDFTLTEIRNYSSGSLEVLLSYCFGEPKVTGQFINPRYF
jgi:type IX secretion system PorP/SprF family membrane protein